jgi:uncharacterized radical SAM protein YgiQ
MHKNPYPKTEQFLPTSAKEMQQLGWKQADIILFSGDAYVDHPSFAAAVIGRMLESAGYKVAIVPQPNWRDDLRDFKKMGLPRLFFGVTAGNMDSMVNHYTANKRLRSDDAYTPGGKAGARPDYPSIVYTKILKQLYPDQTVVLGGIEASMRRFTHYDYWQNKLSPSFLIESGADFLIYGQGEYPVVALANAINNNSDYKNISQLVYKTTNVNINPDKDIILASHENCLTSKKSFADNFVKIETNSNLMHGARVIQQINKEYIVANPPQATLTTKALDTIYELPYQRLPHPRYANKAPIPAFEMIRDSVNIHRGCFGGCSFCTISAHQGKFISSRSEKSILNEITNVCNTPGFKGHITDLGGPSANMYTHQGKDLNICAKCKRASCIFPNICNNLNTSHQALLNLYNKVSKLPNVKKLSIGSGVRYDLMFHDFKNDKSKPKYLEELIINHVSGRLKVAPEHTSSKVLSIMRKPSYEQFKKLSNLFNQIIKKHKRSYQLIPYFISSHPGTNILDMAELAVITKQHGYKLEQVQDFTPTPTTLATVMYYTGIDPYTGKKIEVARTIEQKKSQNKYFFWYKPLQKRAIIQELKKIKRHDLISKLFD